MLENHCTWTVQLLWVGCNQLGHKMYDMDVTQRQWKITVSKFWYFDKYIIQLFGYFYAHVSGQWCTGLER